MNIESGIIKRLHVNRFVILANKKKGVSDPCLKAQTSRGAFYGRRIAILDEQGKEVAVVIQSDKPLSCGARVWVETKNEVVIE